ncbi:MAG TPA: Gfo/Idh/MocA family oxidoreductase [Verrucomicrobiae bacterium]|jgi:predicted dehydrogenase
MNKQVTFSRASRRQFIKYGAMAAGAVAVAGPYPVRGQNLNSKINVAQFGCGGKGSSDFQCIIGSGEASVVACCDVQSHMADRMKKFLKEKMSIDANTYTDFRELFDKEKNFDAVDVATPDHMHAVIAATAIKLGKNVYCQKPLTHDVFEARTLRELARKHNVATQMGNQGSASDSLRRAVEVMHAGVIGPVKEAYVWTNRPIWPQGMDRPPGNDQPPAWLDWNLWLGTAPDRPFKLHWPGQSEGNVYEPFVWRGWQDFGTGALGDMACHTVNWPFRALKLGYPTEIEASSSGINTEMYPSKSKIRFEFPAREGMPPVTLHWSDGGNKPPKEITGDVEAMMGAGRISNSGCIMIGENGVIFSPDDGDQELATYIKLKGDEDMVGLAKHPAAKNIPQSIPRNAHIHGPDGTKRPPDVAQHMEWLQACKDGKHDVPYSNFDIAAYLTEIILLGCVALRTGKKLEWDGPGMMAKNAPEAARVVKREYRAGWSI